MPGLEFFEARFQTFFKLFAASRSGNLDRFFKPTNGIGGDKLILYVPGFVDLNQRATVRPDLTGPPSLRRSRVMRYSRLAVDGPRLMPATKGHVMDSISLTARQSISALSHSNGE